MPDHSQSSGAREAYDAIAPFYDAFTSDHDFELWFGNLLPAVEEHGLLGNRLLDIACGTGKSFLPMIERGWSVTACDLAPKMAAIARRKLQERGVAAPVHIADMRALPKFGQFDLVWCLTDAMNYLLTDEEFVAALAGMRRNLLPTGVLAFDLNTLHGFRTFFAQETIVESSGGRMVWRGRGTPEAKAGSISEATFEVKSDARDKLAIEPSLHRERHFPEGAVLEALERAGLDCLEVFGINYDAVLQQPLEEGSHTKAVYLARRLPQASTSTDPGG
jgi:SAM-dependent methyltransferase